MSDAMKDLVLLTEALYEAELSKMRALNQHEAELRRDLLELETLRKRNQALPAPELDGVRQIGADVLWHGWISRTRDEFNSRLAQVLAQKARLTTGLRHAYGKRQAAADMQTQTREQLIENQDKSHRSAMQELTLLHRYKQNWQ